jgi:hypothetical protein
MKLSLLAAALLTLAAPAGAAEKQSYDALMQSAQVAFQAKDWRALADALDAAQGERPYSLYVMRNRILAYAMLDDFATATAIAAKAADRGLSLRLAGHAGFDALTARPEFAPVAAKMQTNLAPIGVAKIALAHPDNALLPESFASAGKNGPHFVGSVRTGTILRFTKGEAGGFALANGGVYDLEIAGDTLWAAVNLRPPYDTLPSDEPKGGLIAYSLADGAQKSAHSIPGLNALFGDLEILPDGVAASDSVSPRVMILRNESAELAVYAEDPRFVNLQGLAYDKARGKLFVADYLAGLFAIDAKTGAVAAIANTADAHLGGIDGLYLYRGDLIGIQNGTTPQRIVRIRLDKAGGDAVALDVIQQNLADWREPTNGKIVGDALHYVATSNWPAYGEDGAIDEKIERAPLKIMVAPLK